MSCSISIQLGNVTITQAAENLKDAIRKSQFLQDIPRNCPICGAELRFNTYKAKGTKENTKNKEYEYFGVKCVGNPQHSLNFHEYSETAKGFYLKADDEWTTYHGNGRTETPADFDGQARALVYWIVLDAVQNGFYLWGAFKITFWSDG